MNRRGAVILIREERVALIRRVFPHREHYVFPGGQVEPGETVEEAARREVHEELGLDIRLGHLTAIVEFQGDEQYYFLAEITGGTFGTGTGAELRSSVDSPHGSYTPLWVGIDELCGFDVRPLVVAQAIAQRTLDSQRLPLRIVEL